MHACRCSTALSPFQKKKPPFFSTGLLASTGESAWKQGFSPTRSSPQPLTSTIRAQTKASQNPPPAGVVRRIQTKASGSGAVRVTAATCLALFRLQSALLPPWRTDVGLRKKKKKREERRWEWNRKCGQGRGKEEKEGGKGGQRSSRLLGFLDGYPQQLIKTQQSLFGEEGGKKEIYPTEAPGSTISSNPATAGN